MGLNVQNQPPEQKDCLYRLGPHHKHEQLMDWHICRSEVVVPSLFKHEGSTYHILPSGTWGRGMQMDLGF